MKRHLVLLLIILLFTANQLLSQSFPDLLKSYQRLDSIILEASENNPSEAIAAIKEQGIIAQKMESDSLIFLSEINRARILNDLGLFDQTFEILYTLLAKTEKNHNDNRVVDLHFYIGSSYFQMSDHEKSVSHFETAKKLAIQHQKYEDTVKINLELGLVYVGVGLHKKGFEMLEKNLALAKSLKNEELIITGIDNLSNSYFEIGDNENALKYQLELLNYPEYMNDSKHYKTAINQHLAEIYIALQRWDDAQKHVTLAIKYATEMGSNDWLFDCYKNQAAIYEAKGMYKDALLFHQKYLTTKDSVYQKDYDEKMSAMANLYELEHKENLIDRLTIDTQIADAKIERLTFFTAFLILFIGLLITFYQYRKNKTEKDQQQKIAFQLIQAQEDERQRIAKDLHDSVGQNILFLKNQVQNNTDQIDTTKLIKSIDAALQEIRNISKNLYPNQLEKYGLIAAIEALADEVSQSTGIFVSSDMEGIEEILNNNVKINFYRIIQEFVNNTLKHAEATAIRITAQQTDQTIELIVQDNGKGFDKADMQRKANRSFGLINMEERVKMLKGTFAIESEPGKGTKSTFSIPV
jgi:signal transduction histidine kinase